MTRTARYTLATSILLAAIALVAFSMAGRAPGASSAENVNAAVDNGLALALRLLEFPLSTLLLFACITSLLFALLLESRFGRRLPTSLVRVGFVATGLLLLFSLALLADRKISRLQQQIVTLRGKVNADRMTAEPLAVAAARPTAPPLLQTSGSPSSPPPAPSTAPAARAVAPHAVSQSPQTQPAPSPRALMIDLAQVQQRLAATFSGITLRPLVYDAATDAIDIHSTSPLAQAYLTITDLRTPGLQVKIGGSLDSKTLTSAFARVNDCALAINGEAGQSPRANSGLGPWCGYYMAEGELRLREQQNNRRPFLSFDRQNRATFTPMAAADRALPLGSFNVLWGRLDALLDGQVQTADERNRQPRTAMGIDKEGSHLYLIVVDGRQPGYSLGYTRAEVGALLKAFGAANGMLCDEGGSSSMYTRRFGIVNAPSDGEERPTYTHFGIALPAPATLSSR
jgi:hypothetical protein